jgi:hypothetical protein
MGGDPWKRWEAQMRPFLLNSQEAGTGPDAGSWSPQGDTLGQVGGRLMVTSLSLLTLELCAEDELRPVVIPPRSLGDDELAGAWKDLAGLNTYRARRSMALLAADPKKSVTYLKEQLQPVPKADAERIDRLVADLDSENFAARQKAEQELEKLRELPEPALRKLLDAKPSLEVRQRAERLLQRIEDKPAEVMQQLRAVTVLERLGTVEAREVLKHLATGTPEAWQTREAKAALERLDGKAK